MDGAVEGPIAGAVRAESGPGAAAPPGDLVGLGDARGVGEAAAHVEVAAGDREGPDREVERPVTGAVRAESGPGAAVPPGDVVGLGDARGVGEVPAHVEVAAGDREGPDNAVEGPVAGAVRAQGGPGPNRGRGGSAGGCEAGRLAGGEIAHQGPGARIDRAGEARGANEGAIGIQGRGEIGRGFTRRGCRREGALTGDRDGARDEHRHQRAEQDHPRRAGPGPSTHGAVSPSLCPIRPPSRA